MKHKQIEKLDGWINKAQALNITEINSFINGILRDIEAVKNAIIYDYNNGLIDRIVQFNFRSAVFLFPLDSTNFLIISYF